MGYVQNQVGLDQGVLYFKSSISHDSFASWYQLKEWKNTTFNDQLPVTNTAGVELADEGESAIRSDTNKSLHSCVGLVGGVELGLK